jgi:ferric-dicitrate binding protein FerR (iron transport regulator)
MTSVVLAVAATIILAVREDGPRDTLRTAEQIVATGERIEGAPVLRREVSGRAEALPLSPPISIRARDVIETDGASRAALRATDGSSVRLDRGSRLHLVAPAIVELVEGAVYVATSEGARGFEVRTSLGSVRDAGTQFEVRVHATSLRVRVRTGLAEIARPGDVVPVPAGSEATVTPSGVGTRRAPTDGPEWSWTRGLAPALEIEGRSLQRFLDDLTREQGWTLSYADPTLANTASRIVLHGSIAGLPAEDALRVALATSGLQYRLRAGQLLVSRGADAR